MKNIRMSVQGATKILKAAKPANLPIEQTAKFELAVNLKTGKVNVTIPNGIMLRADQVI